MLFDSVKEYLVHYAYVETLQALEEESNWDGVSLQVGGGNTLLDLKEESQ